MQDHPSLDRIAADPTLLRGMTALELLTLSAKVTAIGAAIAGQLAAIANSLRASQAPIPAIKH